MYVLHRALYNYIVHKRNRKKERERKQDIIIVSQPLLYNSLNGLELHVHTCIKFLHSHSSLNNYVHVQLYIHDVYLCIIIRTYTYNYTYY